MSWQEERMEMKLDEAKEAVVEVLSREKGNPIPKKLVIKLTVARIVAERKASTIGSIRDPVIFTGKQWLRISVPTEAWIDRHWSRIVTECIESEIYIVYEDGASGGWFLGTKKDFCRNQAKLRHMSEGFAQTHNERQEGAHEGDYLVVGLED